MLKLVDEPTFRHDVTARVPVDGGYREDKFAATFRVLPISEIEAHDVTTPEGTKAFLEAATAELHELADAEGEPIGYSHAVRDRVLELGYARRALFDAYLKGVGGARQGN